MLRSRRWLYWGNGGGNGRVTGWKGEPEFKVCLLKRKDCVLQVG